MATPSLLPSSGNPTASQLQRESQKRDRRQKTILIAILGGVLIILASLLYLVYLLLKPETPGESVERLRDIFIILVALESLIIGTALIVLIIQLASLINLLQNEVRPILKASSEAVNTIRGTADFLGENVVEPVIELKGYLAGLNRMLELMGIKKR